ncbi:hypothetical protein CspHIS471_0311420 [Cutaneotrichosporon sp. HIS471]|nr:hypothetical protein CspHIS471_0311420 [Cutaneotrichosporon sp. HIS471]
MSAFVCLGYSFTTATPLFPYSAIGASQKYAELDRPASKLERSDNTTEPDTDDTDVSLCITLAALADRAGDAHEQGEVRLCMGADTSPARRVYTRFMEWAAQHPAWSHPVDVARAWASVVQQAFIDML